MSNNVLERNYSYGSSIYDNNETNYKTQQNFNNNQMSQGQSQYNPNLENPQISNRTNERGISLIGTLNQNFGSSVNPNNRNRNFQNSQTQSFYKSQQNYYNNNNTNTENEDLTVTIKKSTKKTKKIRETRNQSPPRMSEFGDNSQQSEEYTSERKMNKMMKMIKNAHIEKIKNFIYLKEINHAYDEMIRLKQEGDLAASKDMERELNKLTETVVQLNLDAFAKTQFAKSHANSFFGNSSSSSKYKGGKNIYKTAREKKVKSIFDSTTTKTKIRKRNFRKNNGDNDNYEEMIEEEEEEEEEEEKTKNRNKNKKKSQEDERGNNAGNQKSNQGNYNNQNNNSNYNNNTFEKSQNQNSYKDYPNQDYANSNYNLNDPNPNNMVYGEQYQRGIAYQDNIMRGNQNLRSRGNPGAQPNIIQNFKSNLYQQSNANQKQDGNNKNNSLIPSFFVAQNQSGNNNNISHNNRTQEQQFTTDKDARTDNSPPGTLNVDEEGNIINNKKEGKDILSNTLLAETILLPNQSNNQTLIQKQNIEQTDLFKTSEQYIPFIQKLPESENPNDPNQSQGVGTYTGSNERGNPLYPNNGQKIFPPNSQNPNLERQEYPGYQKSLSFQQNAQNPRLINPNIQRDPYYYPNQVGEGTNPPGIQYINPNLPHNQRYPRKINPNTGLPYDRQGRPYQPQPQYSDNSSANLRDKKDRNRRPKSTNRPLMYDRNYNVPNDSIPLYKFRDRFRASMSRSKSRSNSKNRTKSPADIPFSYSTQGKCFACNVDCNISKSGNSSNNFVPYMASFKKKRIDETYYDGDKYGYYQ